jgi:hypothetical protein
MKLNTTERDAVLAGLRLLQHFLGEPRTCVLTDSTGTPSHAVMDDIEAIACDHGDPMTADAIDALCERLNR